MASVESIDNIQPPQTFEFEELKKNNQKEEDVQKIASPLLNSSTSQTTSAPIDPKRVTASKFPDVARSAVNAAIAREKAGTEKLQQHSKEVKEHTKNIDMLLDFSAEIGALPDGESHAPTEKMKMIAEELKKNGIDLLRDEKKINKSELKSLISSKIDNERTKLQTKITTEIQPELSNLNSIMATMQQMIQSVGRLIRGICERSIK